jgi:hypothetical protein
MNQEKFAGMQPASADAEVVTPLMESVPQFPPAYFGGFIKKPDDGQLSICFEGWLILPEGRRRAYFKTDPSRYAMLNEEIGYMLAKASKLPQPKAGRIWIQGGLLHAISPTSWPDPTKHALCWVTYQAKDIAGKAAPSVTAKLKIGTNNLNEPELLKIIMGIMSKFKLLARLIVFDAWIANVDRNTGNILVVSQDSFVLIDHGAVLGGPTWPAAIHSQPDSYVATKILDVIYEPAKDTLSLPTKTAIVKECELLAKAYEEAASWLEQSLSPSRGAAFSIAHDFLRERVKIIGNHMREKTGLLA